MFERLKAHIPSRESLEGNRWLRPFARHLASPNLWRFNRRSVPRGVAVGLFCGVLVPVAHTPIAVMGSIPARANAIVAAASTWVINPLTIPPLLIAAHWIGRHVIAPAAPGSVPAGRVSWLHTGMTLAGTTAIGLVPLALLAGGLGYALAAALWRLHIARRRSRPRGA